MKAVIRCRKLQPTKIVKKKAGRKHKLGSRCQNRLLIYVSNNNRQPLFAIANSFLTKDGVKLLERNKGRYLHSGNIKSYVAASKPYLTAKHTAARLNWCAIRQQSYINQWSKVAFTDESSFTQGPIKNCARI